jgi:RNA polymerase sigma factor (sigma-70 family)
MTRTVPVLHRAGPGPHDALVASTSFESFYDAERDGLFGALVLITGSRSEAEEIAQDAFLAVWRRWDRVGEMENPPGYLYRTAMNAFRRRRYRASLALRRAVGRGPAEDAFAQVEARDAVDRALAGLSPRQRAALVLTELLGFSSEEAGRALGIKASTVRALSAQGREAIRRTTRWPDA